MAEALAKVKQYFGNDALILGTRTYSRGTSYLPRLGRDAKRVVEITAVKNAFCLQGPPRRGRVRRDSGATGAVEGAAKLMPEAVKNKTRDDQTLVALSAEVGALKSAVTDLVTETRRRHVPAAFVSQLPAELQESYQELIEAQVAEEIARELVCKVRADLSDQELTQPSAIRARLASYVESMLPLSDPVPLADGPGPTIIALVGPTGTGKTTTVAKLAANYHLREGYKVGLITLDTYRIAAVDQLRTYAGIIGVPLQVVATLQQMRAALTALGDCRAILIDTVGSSQNDDSRLLGLKKLLDEAKPHEVHLVLATTASLPVLTQTINRFSSLGVNRLIFTKLDEAVGFGVILNCLLCAQAGLSYVTTGQHVPDDIEAARPASLAERIVSAGRSGHRPDTRITPGLDSGPGGSSDPIYESRRSE